MIFFVFDQNHSFFYADVQESGGCRINSPLREVSVILIFAEPVAIFLTNKLNGLTYFLKM